MKNKITILIQAIALGLLSSNQVVVAADNISTKESEPVIVTATRLQSETNELPANITIITAEDIQSSPASTLPDILSLEAGVNSRSLYGNNAARSTVDMRGFGAAAKSNTLILLDGRRLNDIDLSPIDFAAIPIANIERIEIIRGGSVLYGDGAVGGSINIITRQEAGAKTYSNAKLILASYDSHQLEGNLKQIAGPLSVNLSANAQESDGYRNHNTMRQQNLQADIRSSQSNGQLFLKFGADNQHIDLPGVRTVDPTIALDEISTDRKGTGTPNDYADQEGYFITAGISHFITDNTEFVIDLGYRHKNQKSFFDDYVGWLGGGFPVGTWASYIDTDLNTWSLTPRMRMDYGSNMHNTLTTGIDLYDSSYTSDRAQTQGASSKHIYDAKQTSLAVYAHNITQLNKDTSLTAGARLQRLKTSFKDTFNAASPGDPFGSAKSPLTASSNEHMLELGIKHQLNNSISLFGKLERSVRFATLDEILEAGTLPFEPQTAAHVDVGVNMEYGKHKLNISAYHMQIRNEIHYDIATSANENLDPTKRHGLEITGSTSINNRLKLNANYAYTRSKFTDGNYTGNEVPVVSKNTASLAASWAFISNMNATATANYIGSKYFDNDQQNSLFKIPAYTTVDLKLNSTRNKWKIEGAIHNLLDEKAFDYGVKSTATPGRYNAYPLPERNFSLSFSRSF